MSYARSLLRKIENGYDPDNDLIPGAPEVTWADMTLDQTLEEALNRIDHLEEALNRIDHLEAEIGKLKGGDLEEETRQ